MPDTETTQPVAEGMNPPADAALGGESALDLITQGAIELMRSATPAEDVEEPTDEDEDEDVEDDEEEAEEPAEDDEDEAEEGDEPAPQSDPGLERAIGLLARDPANLTQVPRKYRVDAIKGLAQMAFDAGLERGAATASQQAQQQAQQQVGEARLVAELDALADSDPEGFEERQRGDPAEAARYWAAKAQQRTLEEPPNPIQQQAERVLARLRDDRGATERVLARINAGEFSLTEEGLTELAVAVGEELAASKAASTTEVATARRRGQAAARRRTAPKPVVGPSFGGSGQTEDLSDTTALLKAGMAAAQRSAREGRVPNAVAS